ncbi:MAG: response regulator [Brevundimonas sp.]|uniref:response regulator transcription factor n=1 Tax=Brevundimonas sp. TaxID=1871086 RepID=UPI002734FD9B|nr:response regulator [Brevundimonas sp.]MBX9616492.1 response regulator [Caulobacteraceae bacterium]MDP3403746.1 response regulator [Brevundimonas sp.]
MTKAILIAEDDETIRELVNLILTQAGFKVVTASDGKEALELMERTRFDLVLLDVHMPRMNGLDVLGAMAHLCHMPRVLMVSANCAAEVVRKAIGLGCLGYLAKPFAPAALVARVNHALTCPTAAFLI